MQSRKKGKVNGNAFLQGPRLGDMVVKVMLVYGWEPRA